MKAQRSHEPLRHSQSQIQEPTRVQTGDCLCRQRVAWQIAVGALPEWSLELLETRDAQKRQRCVAWGVATGELPECSLELFEVEVRSRL